MPRADALTIERFRADPERVAALARIYEAAIDASERKPLAGLLSDPAMRTTVAVLDGELAGFAMLRLGRSCDLLEYLAVRAEVGGAGIGGRLYCAALDDRERAAPLLIEVDSEREDCSDREVRLRRKAFYRRLGARQIAGLDYILPLAIAGTPPAMDLMIDACADVSVSRETVGVWLQEIYCDAYGCARDDPRILTMLGTLEAEVPLV